MNYFLLMLMGLIALGVPSVQAEKKCYVLGYCKFDAFSASLYRADSQIGQNGRCLDLNHEDIKLKKDALRFHCASSGGTYLEIIQKKAGKAIEAIEEFLKNKLKDSTASWDKANQLFDYALCYPFDGFKLTHNAQSTKDH